MTSVLEKTLTPSTRPYSTKELESLINQLWYDLRIGSIKICHEDCGHFYYAKFGGKKEKDFLESKQQNPGNCSVCWKLSKTPRPLRKRAESLVSDYCTLVTDEESVKPSSFRIYSLQQDFYTWLYDEFNPERI